MPQVLIAVVLTSDITEQTAWYRSALRQYAVSTTVEYIYWTHHGLHRATIVVPNRVCVTTQ